MRTLKETLLDKTFDVSSGYVLFNSLCQYPSVDDNDCRLDKNNEFNELVEEIIDANINHLDDIDPEITIHSVLSSPKFVQLTRKIKCEEGIYCDIPDSTMDTGFNDEMWDRFVDFRNKRLGRAEFKKKIKGAFLSLEIYSLDEFYFTFLVDNNNYIYGFIACN